jgi:hypothetical protein
MAKISVGAAVSEGFSLIRRHPGSVALWALLTWAFLIIRFASYGPLIAAGFAQMQSGAAPNMMTLLPQLQQAQALGFLLSLGSLFLNAVLACAVYRAVLRPEQVGFAYLRIGAAEFFLFLFIIAASMVFVIGTVVLLIPLGIIGGLIGRGSLVGGVTFGVIAAILYVFGAIYLILRLALVGPVMVETNEFRVGEAWALTRGRVGSLFAIALLLVVVIIVAELVLVGLGFAMLGAAVGGFGQFTSFMQQQPMVLLSRLGPLLAIEGVAWLVVIACALPVVAAPWASAYRDLKQTDLSATFS